MIGYKTVKYRMFPTKEQSEIIKYILKEYNFCVKRFVGEVKLHVLKAGYNYLSNEQLKFLSELIDSVDIYEEQKWLKKENKIFHEAAKEMVLNKLSQLQARKACYKFGVMDKESMIGTSIKITGIDKIARYQMFEGSLYIPNIGDVKYKNHKILPSGSQVNAMTFTALKNGKYYVTLWYSFYAGVPTQNIYKPEVTLREVPDDYFKGCGYPLFFHKNRLLISQRKKKLGKMQENQRDLNKVTKSLSSLLVKLSNQRLDFIHKVTKNLSENYSRITLETLNNSTRSSFRNRVGTRNFLSITKDMKRELFRSVLSYKCKLKGVDLVIVGKGQEDDKSGFE